MLILIHIVLLYVDKLKSAYGSIQSNFASDSDDSTNEMSYFAALTGGDDENDAAKQMSSQLLVGLMTSLTLYTNYM